MLAPAGASAAVACGDEIDDDAKLQTDLDCSGFAQPGLTITGNGVDLDLNGHTINGPDDQPGITATEKRNGLTIRDGKITGFNHAVELLFGGKNLELSNLRMNVRASNSMGAYFGEFNHADLSGLRVRNANYGTFVFASADVVTRNSVIRGGNATGQIIGINEGDSGGHSGAIHNVKVRGATYGFYLYGPTPGFTVTDSSANGNSYAGFYLASNDPSPYAYALKNNVAKNNDEFGFFSAFRVPVSINNRASGNGTKDCRRVRCV